MDTALITHDYFYSAIFHNKDDHPHRLTAIRQAFRNIFPDAVSIDIEDDGGKAALSIHSGDYVRFIMDGAHQTENAFMADFPVFTRKEMIFTQPKTFSGRNSLYFFDNLTNADPSICKSALLAAAGAMSAAQWVNDNFATRKMAYLLCRPPGHHSFCGFSGGLCIFNNAAIAAKTLKVNGKVVIIDLDQEHGNGTQSLFFNDPDVLTVSIHSNKWPLVSGFPEEVGGTAALGSNINIQVEEGTKGGDYLKVFEHALDKIIRFEPAALVIALGFDAHKQDSHPWILLNSGDFAIIGSLLQNMNVPTVVTQEGGYDPVTNFACAREFFKAWRK